MKPALCLALLVLLPSAAQAARVQDGPPLSPEELDSQVGGFRTPGGLEIGFGAVVHDLNDVHFGSLVFNTADNRDIRTDTAITLDIPHLDQMQRTVANQQLDVLMQDAVGRALEQAVRQVILHGTWLWPTIP